MENFIWAQFDDDLDSILETAISGPVYRKLSHTILAMNELALMTEKEITTTSAKLNKLY